MKDHELSEINSEFPTSIPSCPICGSKMIKVSENPDVWFCQKCGFKYLSESKRR